MTDFNIAINLKANDLGASQVIRGLNGNLRKLNSTTARRRRTDDLIGGSALRLAGTEISRFGATGRVSISEVVSAAATLEQRLADVRAVTSDARNITTSDDAKKNFEQLSALAKNLGATTEFTAAEAADGLKFLGIAGLNTKQQLATLPAVLDLATASETDLANTSDFVTDIMEGFGIEAEKTRQVTDVLTKTFTESNTTLTFLSRSLFKVGPLARTAGVSMTEMSAAAGFLGSQGIKGAEAGTALRNSLLAMTGTPSKRAEKALRAIGLTSKELKKTLDAKGFEGAFLKISSGMAKLASGSEKLKTAEGFFGKRTASAAAALAKGFESGELVEFRQELERSGGTTLRVAGIMRDTALNKLKLFESAIDGIKVQLGNEFIPILQDMLPDILAGAKGFSRWVKENRTLIPILAKAALGVVAVTSVVGPLLAGLGTAKLLVAGFGGSASITAAVLPTLTTAIGSLSGVAGIAAGSIGVLGAAVAGFSAGAMIDEVFGISDAIVRANRDLDKIGGHGPTAKLADFTKEERERLDVLKDDLAKAQADIAADDSVFSFGPSEAEEKAFRARRKIENLHAKVAIRAAKQANTRVNPDDNRNAKTGVDAQKPAEKQQVDIKVKVDRDNRLKGISVEQAAGAGGISEGL